MYEFQDSVATICLSEPAVANFLKYLAPVIPNHEEDPLSKWRFSLIIFVVFSSFSDIDTQFRGHDFANMYLSLSTRPVFSVVSPAA